MDRTDDILERLKGKFPTVPDAESLTGRIMAAIDGAERKDHVPIPLWIIVTRTVSTAAAAAMLFWFIHVTEPNRTTVVQETPVLEISGSEPGDLFTESTAVEIIRRQIERSMRHQIKRTTESLTGMPYERFDK